MSKLLLPIILALIAALLSACSGNRDPLDRDGVDVSDLLTLRHYDVPTNDTDPQPAWSPNGNWLMIRSQRSLVMLREGGRRVHRTAGGRRPDNAQWLSNSMVAFGPTDWVTRTDEGKILVPTEGIRLLDVEGDGQVSGYHDIAEGAWRPRRWGKQIVAQRAASIFAYQHDGAGELIDEGYFPEPHPQGEGITLQTTPMIAPDYWTGSDKLGNLVVRWPNGRTDLYTGLVEAAWCGDGGIVATRLRGLPKDLGQWWSVGTDVVHIAGPGASPTLVMADARHPSPHPTQAIVAVTGPSDVVFICNRDGSLQREVVDGARRACWSPSGRHLAVERPDPGTGLVDMRIFVFKARD